MKLDSDEELENEEKKNPTSRAEREKEFREQGQRPEIYTDPKDVY